MQYVVHILCDSDQSVWKMWIYLHFVNEHHMEIRMNKRRKKYNSLTLCYDFWKANTFLSYPQHNVHWYTIHFNANSNSNFEFTLTNICFQKKRRKNGCRPLIRRLYELFSPFYIRFIFAHHIITLHTFAAHFFGAHVMCSFLLLLVLLLHVRSCVHSASSEMRTSYFWFCQYFYFVLFTCHL